MGIAQGICHNSLRNSYDRRPGLHRGGGDTFRSRPHNRGACGRDSSAKRLRFVGGERHRGRCTGGQGGWRAKQCVQCDQDCRKQHQPGRTGGGRYCPGGDSDGGNRPLYVPDDRQRGTVRLAGFRRGVRGVGV